MPHKIMFVCLGNICRSPLAQAVMEHIVQKNGAQDSFLIDSAGTGGWHVGEPADKRMRKTAARHGIIITHLAQQFKQSHLETFDYIFAMDRQNERDIFFLDQEKKHHHKIYLFRGFAAAGHSPDVPDPYYGGIAGFEAVFKLVLKNCEAIYQKIGDKPN